jgi:hypothetical protein
LLIPKTGLEPNKKRWLRFVSQIYHWLIKLFYYYIFLLLQKKQKICLKLTRIFNNAQKKKITCLYHYEDIECLRFYIELETFLKY